MSDNGVCRIAPSTPGLFISLNNKKLIGELKKEKNNEKKNSTKTYTKEGK